MITYEEAHEYFEYRDGKLYRKRNIGIGRAGQRAGYLHPEGYWKVKYRQRAYPEHRLIWFMYHGYWPKLIDHINMQRSDNRIENLRECTRAQNKQNSKAHRNSSSKYKGVYWEKTRGKWRAHIQTGKKLVMIGYFDDEIEAARAYDKMAIEVFGEFVRTNFPREDY